MGIDKKSSDFFFKPLNDEVALEKVIKINKFVREWNSFTKSLFMHY